jgi:serine/threonine-protein kinase
MADVFVSYKADDRRRVKPLVAALEADGFSVWWDEQIGGGAAWRHTIEAELNAAKSVVVAWSKRSVGPDGIFVQDEATRAQERRVYIPVIIDKVHLPLGFGETQALHLNGWRGDRSDLRYQAVLSAVRRLAGDRQASAIVTGPAVDRRLVLAGGTAATVAIVGAGAWALLKPSASSANSIAVLPFANLSGDPSQAYFSDGIAEEIRSALARLGGLTVIGRTSSEAVRHDDSQTAASKLHVENILTGSVRQSASTIRITAELVDGRTGADRWSQDYDRSPGDAIRIQTDIAENVARSLSAALGHAARAAIELGGTDNPEAHRFLLQAIESALADSKGGHQRAFKLFDSAIALDPRYADAYAQKAYLLEFYADNFANTVAEVRTYRLDALQTANRALQLAPKLSSAHLALAQYYDGILDVAHGGRELRRALELSPSDPAALRNQAIYLVRFGDRDEALRLADRSVASDPLNPGMYRTRFLVLFYCGKFAEALAFTTELEKKSPEFSNWASYVGWAAVFSGNLDRAQHYFDLAPLNEYRRLVGESDLLIRQGRRADAEGKLSKMMGIYGDTANYQYAQVYAQLGEKDRAVAALDRAWAFRDNGLAWTRVDPHLNPLRGDPRYAALLAKMHFPR